MSAALYFYHLHFNSLQTVSIWWHIWLHILRVNLLNLSARWKDLMANLVLVKIARMQTKATCYQTVWYLLDHLRCSFSQEIDVIEVLQRSPSLKGRRVQTDVYLWRREISCRHAENCHAEEQTNLSLHGEYTEQYGDTWTWETKDSFTLCPTSVFENGTEVIVVTVTY